MNPGRIGTVVFLAIFVATAVQAGVLNSRYEGNV